MEKIKLEKDGQIAEVDVTNEFIIAKLLAKGWTKI